MKRHLLILLIMISSLLSLFGQVSGDGVLYEFEAEALPISGEFELVSYDTSTDLVRVKPGGTVNMTVAFQLDAEGLLYMRGRVIEPELIDLYLNGEKVELTSTGGLSWVALDGGSFSGLTPLNVKLVNRGGLLDLDRIVFAKRGAISLGASHYISDIIAESTAERGLKLYFSGEDLKGSRVKAYRKMTVEGYTDYLRDTLGPLSQSELAVKVAEYLAKPESLVGEATILSNREYSIVDPAPLNGYRCHYYLAAEGDIGKALNSKKITLTYSSLDNSVQILKDSTNPVESYLYRAGRGAIRVEEGSLTQALSDSPLYLNSGENILALPSFLENALYLKGKVESSNVAFSLNQGGTIYIYLPEIDSIDRGYYFSRGYNLLKVPVKLSGGQSGTDSYFFYKSYRAGSSDSIYLESPAAERFRGDSHFKVMVEADDLVIYFDDRGTTLEPGNTITMQVTSTQVEGLQYEMLEISPGLWQARIPGGALSFKSDSLTFAFRNELFASESRVGWSWDFYSYVAAKRAAMSAVLFFTPHKSDNLDVNFSNGGNSNHEGLEDYLIDRGELYGLKGNGWSYGFNTVQKLFTTSVLRGEAIKGSYITSQAGDTLKIELDTGDTPLSSSSAFSLNYNFNSIEYLTAEMINVGGSKWEAYLPITKGVSKLYFSFSDSMGNSYDNMMRAWEWSFYRDASFSPIYESDPAEREYILLAGDGANRLDSGELKNWSIALPKGDYSYRMVLEKQVPAHVEQAEANIRVENRVYNIPSSFNHPFDLRGSAYISDGKLSFSNVGAFPLKLSSVYLKRADNLITSILPPHNLEFHSQGSYSPIADKSMFHVRGSRPVRARFKVEDKLLNMAKSGVKAKIELLFSCSELKSETLILATNSTFNADSIVAEVKVNSSHKLYSIDLSDYRAAIKGAGGWLELYIKPAGPDSRVDYAAYLTQLRLSSTLTIDGAFAYQAEGSISRVAAGQYTFKTTDGLTAFNSYSDSIALDSYLNIPVMVKGYKEPANQLYIMEVTPLIRVLSVNGDNYTNKLSLSWAAECTPGATGLLYRVLKQQAEYTAVSGFNMSSEIRDDGEYLLDIVPTVGSHRGEAYLHPFIVDRTGPELTVAETIPAYVKDRLQRVNLSAKDSYSKNLDYYYRVDNRETNIQGSPVKLGRAAGDYNLELTEGRVRLNLYALDELGNSSELYTRELTVDTLAPTIGMEPRYIVREEGGVKRQSVMIEFYLNDNLSTQNDCKIYYRVGTGVWKDSSSDLVELDFNSFTADGTYHITAYAIDQAGNRGQEQTVSFVIDRVPIALAPEYEVTLEKGSSKLVWTDLAADESFSHYSLRRVPAIRRGDGEEDLLALVENSFVDQNGAYNPDAIYYLRSVDIYGNESPEIECAAMKKQMVTGIEGERVTLNMSEPGHKIVIRKSSTGPQYIGMLKNDLKLDKNILGEYGLMADNIYYFGPHGTVFDSPITWKIPISDLKSEYPFKKEELTVRYFNRKRNHWETVETLYNSAEDCLEAKLHHFSNYGVAHKDEGNKIDQPKRVTTVSSRDGSLNSVIDLISLPSSRGSYDLKIDFNSNRYNRMSKSLFEYERLYMNVRLDFRDVYRHEYRKTEAMDHIYASYLRGVNEWINIPSQMSKKTMHSSWTEPQIDYSENKKLIEEMDSIDNVWKINIPQLLKENPEQNNYKYIRLFDGAEYELNIENGSYKNVNGHRFIINELEEKSADNVVTKRYLVKTPEGKNYLFNQEGLIEVIFYSNSPDQDVVNLDKKRYLISFDYNTADRTLEKMSSYGTDGNIKYSLKFYYGKVFPEGALDEKFYVKRLVKIEMHNGTASNSSKPVKEVNLGYIDLPSYTNVSKSLLYTYNKSAFEKNRAIKINYKRLSKVAYVEHLSGTSLNNGEIKISYKMDREYEFMKFPTDEVIKKERHKYNFFKVYWQNGLCFLTGHGSYSDYRDVTIYGRFYLSSGTSHDSPEWKGRIKTLSSLIIDRKNSVEEYQLDDYFRVKDDSFFSSILYSYCTSSRIYRKDSMGVIVDSATNKYTPETTYYHYKRNGESALMPFSRMVEVKESSQYSAGADGKVTALKESNKLYFTESINNRIYGATDIKSGVIEGEYNKLAFAAYESDPAPADGGPAVITELGEKFTINWYKRDKTVTANGNRIYSKAGSIKVGAGDELSQNLVEQDYTQEDNLKSKKEYADENNFKLTEYSYAAGQGADSLYLNPKVESVTEHLSENVTLTRQNSYDKGGSTAGLYRLTKSVVKRSDDADNVIVNHYEYDANDRLTREVRSDSETVISGLIKDYTYDSLGNVIETRVRGKTKLVDKGTGSTSSTIIKDGERTIVTGNYYGSISNRLRAVKEYEQHGTLELGKRLKLLYYDDKGRAYRTVTLHYDDTGNIMAKADVVSKVYNEHASSSAGKMLYVTGSWTDIEDATLYSKDLENLSATGGVYSEALAGPTKTTDQVVYDDYLIELKSLKSNDFDFRLSTAAFIEASYSLHYGSYVLKQVEYKRAPGALNSSATRRYLDIKVDSRGNPLSKTTDSNLLYSYEYDMMGELKKEIFPAKSGMDPVFYARLFEKYGVRSYKYYNGTEQCSPEKAHYYEMSRTDGLGRAIYTRKKSADSESGIDIVETVRYNGRDEAVSKTGPAGEVELTTYNLFGVVDRTVTALDGSKLVTEWNSYDRFGNSTKEYSEIAMNSKSDTPLTEKLYDQFGLVVKETINRDVEILKEGVTGKNVVVERAYYRAGQPLLEVSNIYPEAALNRTEYSYNGYGLETKKRYYSLDPSDLTTLIRYEEDTSYDLNRRVKSKSTTRKIGAGTTETISRTIMASYNNDGELAIGYSIKEGGNWVKTVNTYNDNSQIIRTDEITLDNNILTATAEELKSAAVKRTMTGYTLYDDIYRESITQGADGTLSKVTYNSRGLKDKEYSGLKIIGRLSEVNGKITSTVDTTQAIPTEYIYNKAGLLIKEQIGTLYEKSIGYDSLGRKTKVVSNPNTEREMSTEYGYDQLGREVKIRNGHIIKEVLKWETGAGRTKELRTTITDSSGRTIYKSYLESENYSLMGNLIESRDRDGYIYRERVNELGETVYSSKSILENGVERLIRKAENYYTNSIHRGGTVIKVVGDIKEESQVDYTYTAKGETASITTNRKRTEGTVVTTEPTVVKAFTYTPAGKVKSETTKAGGDSRTISYTYDQTGDLIELIYPDGTKKVPTYDPKGRLKSLKQGVREIVSAVEYDQNITYSYKIGEGVNTISKSYTFNDLMQIEKIDYNNGAFSQSYSYDKAGNITGIDEAAVDNSLVKTVMNRVFRYDGRNRLINAKYKTVANSKGKILYQLNPEVSYRENDYHPTRPSLKRTTPAEVDIQKGASSIIAEGGWNREIKPDFIRIDREGLNRLVESRQINLLYQNSAGGFERLDETLGQYTINKSDNYFDLDIKEEFIAKAFKLNFEPNAMNSSRTSLDSGTTKRLNEIARFYSYATEMEISYSYDHFDNRESITNRLLKKGALLESKSNNYEYTLDKRLLVGDNLFNYHYDLEGNLVKKAEKGSSTNYWQYNWSADGYLIRVDKYVANAIVFTEKYLYDESGVRLLTESSDIAKGEASTTRYVYDGSELIFESTTKGTETTDKKMVYALGELQAVITGAGLSEQATYYHSDVIGSTRFTTNANWVSNDFIFDPFGNEELVGTSTYNGESNYYTFAGHVPKNEKTGLSYMKARWMDNASGRFISRDPAKDGLNWYVYCGNNPTTMIDPTGLKVMFLGGTANNFKFQLSNLSFFSTDFWDNASDGFFMDREGLYFILADDTMSMSPIIRTERELFTDTVSNETDKYDFVTNSIIYDAARRHRLNDTSPIDVTETVLEGMIIQDGRMIAGRSEPNMFYFAYNKDGSPTYSFNFGNPPDNVDLGIGGVGPLIINGLRYNNINLYREGVPEGAPVSGDPGKDYVSYLLMRSNNTLKSNMNESDRMGKIIIAHSSERNKIMIIVQQHSIDGAGIGFDEYRDRLYELGFDNAIFLDCSNSVFLNVKGRYYLSATNFKNKTNTMGIGFKVK